MRETFIYVYQTICLINGKNYVGIHKTDNLNDGYIGCGVYRQNDAKRNLFFHKAVRKYGYANFKRHILSFYDTYQDALDEEKYIVTKEWVRNKANYNTAMGGRGNSTAWMDSNKKDKWRDNIKTAVREWMGNGGRELMIQARKTAKRSRKFGKDNPLYGKPSFSRRKINQFDKSGNLVAVHDSVHAAAKAINGSIGNITSCCQGVYKHCAGFVFRYENYSNVELDKLTFNLNTVKVRKPIPKGRRHSPETINKIIATKAYKKSLLPPAPPKPLKEKKTRIGIPLSESHKKALKENSARYWLGKKMPREMVEKGAKKRIGQKRTPEQREKMSISNKGKPSNNRVNVLQYSIDGKFINDYNSCTEAAIAIGCCRSSISNNLIGLTTNCKNFVFKYKSKEVVI